jgi:putative ABC transport system ATP-binding protein
MPNSPSVEPAGLEISGLRLQFAGVPQPAIEIGHLTVEPGETVGLYGPSGSGKTTLIHLVAGLLPPDAGHLIVGGREISGLTESERDRWRRTNVGLVFQDFHLIPELDALGNILLPSTFGGAVDRTAWRTRADILARRLGIADLRQSVSRLSRGEQQRVAVIRALVHRPRLVLADEPTASLDADNAALVGAALVEETRAIGATLLVATHDARLIERLDRRIELNAGRIVGDTPGARGVAA